MRSCKSAEDLALHAERHFRDLVEKQRALIRLDEETGARRARVGERALRVAEELAFQQIFRNGRAVDGQEGTASSAALVERAGDELLARSAFAGDEHVRIGFSDLVDDVGDAAHARARADHVRKLLSIHPPAQASKLVAHRVVAHRAVDGESERFHRHRFGDEVVRARSHRCDGVLEAAEPRHHDDEQVGTLCERRPAELDAVHAVHVDIGKQHGDVAAVEFGQGLLGGRAPNHGVTAGRKARLGELAHFAIVIDDENSGLRAGYRRTIAEAGVGSVHGVSADGACLRHGRFVVHAPCRGKVPRR